MAIFRYKTYFFPRITHLNFPGYLALFVLLLNGFTSYGNNKEKIKKASGKELPQLLINLPYDEMVSDLDFSKTYYKKSLRFIDKNKPELSGDINLKLGIVYYLSGEYDSAFLFNQKAISFYENAHNELKTGTTYCLTGYQLKRRDLKQAFHYYRKGLPLVIKSKNKRELATAYDNYGVLHEMNEALDSALYFYQKSLALKTNLNDSIALPYSYNNIGGVYLLQNNFEAAKEQFEKGREIRIRINDKMGIAESLSSLGDLHTKWNKIRAAIGYYHSSNKLCEEIKYPYLIQYNSEKLAANYEKSNQTDSAIFHLKKSYSIKDSLFNEKNNKTLIEFETRFKTAEKDKEIALLDKKITAEKLENEKNKNIIYAISLTLVLLFFSAVLFIQHQRRKAKAQKDAAIIAEREKGIELMIQATEEERKRIAKELHDGVGQQMTAVKMSWQNLSSKINSTNNDLYNELVKITTMLDDASRDVRAVSHQMMPRTLIEMGLKEAIEDMLSKSLGSANIKYQFDCLGINERLPEKVEITLFRIAQELTNNIIKHSNANQAIFQLIKRSGQIVFIVEDNGKGISTNTKDGIGIFNMVSRINTINGHINFEPGPETGTLVTVRIPL